MPECKLLGWAVARGWLIHGLHHTAALLLCSARREAAGLNEVLVVTVMMGQMGDLERCRHCLEEASCLNASPPNAGGPRGEQGAGAAAAVATPTALWV